MNCPAEMNWPTCIAIVALLAVGAMFLWQLPKIIRAVEGEA